MSVGQESAETIALQAFAWLAGQQDLFTQFLQASGADLGTLRARLTEAPFQIAVLDFLMSEDALVIAFCDQAGLPYDMPDQARQALPGGARVHWT